MKLVLFILVCVLACVSRITAQTLTSNGCSTPVGQRGAVCANGQLNVGTEQRQLMDPLEVFVHDGDETTAVRAAFLAVNAANLAPSGDLLLSLNVQPASADVLSEQLTIVMGGNGPSDLLVNAPGGAYACLRAADGQTQTALSSGCIATRAAENAEWQCASDDSPAADSLLSGVDGLLCSSIRSGSALDFIAIIRRPTPPPTAQTQPPTAQTQPPTPPTPAPTTMEADETVDTIFGPLSAQAQADLLSALLIAGIVLLVCCCLAFVVFAYLLNKRSQPVVPMPFDEEKLLNRLAAQRKEDEERLLQQLREERAQRGDVEMQPMSGGGAAAGSRGSGVKKRKSKQKIKAVRAVESESEVEVKVIIPEQDLYKNIVIDGTETVAAFVERVGSRLNRPLQTDVRDYVLFKLVAGGEREALSPSATLGSLNFENGQVVIMEADISAEEGAGDDKDSSSSSEEYDYSDGSSSSKSASGSKSGASPEGSPASDSDSASYAYSYGSSDGDSAPGEVPSGSVSASKSSKPSASSPSTTSESADSGEMVRASARHQKEASDKEASDKEASSSISASYEMSQSDSDADAKASGSAKKSGKSGSTSGSYSASYSIDSDSSKDEPGAKEGLGDLGQAAEQSKSGSTSASYDYSYSYSSSSSSSGGGSGGASPSTASSDGDDSSSGDASSSAGSSYSYQDSSSSQ